MNFYGDYHTHTYNSDGKSSLEDNVKEAVKKGFKQIAITDHGFNRYIKCIRRSDIKRMRNEVERLKKIYNIDILLGVEANIISSEGDIDVNKEDMDKLDFVVCGFHKLIKPKYFLDHFKLFIPNVFCDIFHIKPSKKRIEKNTQAYLKMLDKNKIDILAHPNHDFKIDVVAVAKKAQEVGTLFEINCKHDIEFSDNDAKKLKAAGIMFIVDSDAHLYNYVGAFTRAENFINKYGIDEKHIANLNKYPQFLNYKNKD